MRHSLQKLNTRLMAVLLVLVMLASVVPAVYADSESGSCGDDLSWSLSAGTLTISGSGAMTDFPESTMAPWYPYREEIVRVSLPSGLTSVGDLAFYGCENLTAVVIPDSVTKIGRYAFAMCTGMELLNLGSGVRTIGEAAFSDCVSLTSLRLPASLQSIGLKAFYRCEAVTSVTVPSSVTSLGVSAFGYCKSLVSANVQASITTIPEFLFYGCELLTSVTLPDQTGTISEFAFRGCDQLNTVHYSGTSITPDQIQDIIGSDVLTFENTGFVTSDSASDSAMSGSATENSDGTVTQENVTVTEKDNVSVSTKVESTLNQDGTVGATSADIIVTVEGDKGWEDAKDVVEEALDNVNNSVSSDSGPVRITIYVKDTDEINSDFIDSLAGKNVNVTVVTQNGSVWRMDSTQMDREAMSGKYDLSYTLTAGSEELCAELETGACFVLRFKNSAEVNAEVLIRLGTSWALQNATLFQRTNKELGKVQTVVVDKNGYAHFYLASVNNEIDYYIAMNLPAQGEAIVPDELLEEFGNPIRYEPIKYEITGRTSSWGLNINQVTWIMVGALLLVVVVVGFVVYALNKRRLKRGYIPELDEEDYQ